MTYRRFHERWRKGITKIYKITVVEEKNGAYLIIYDVKSPNVRGKHFTLVNN